MFLASCSPEDFVRLIGRALGTVGVVGAGVEVVDGISTGRLDRDLVHGPEKAHRVSELADGRGLSLERAVASDCANDGQLELTTPR